MADEEKDIEIEIKAEESAEESAKKALEAKEGPPEGSKRWNEIYWAAKEGERARKEVDALKVQLDSDRALMKEMGEHNKSLAEVLEKIHGTMDKSGVDSEVAKLESNISDLRASKKAAREKADFDAEDIIDEQLAKARFNLEKIKEAKPKAEAPVKKPDEKIVPPPDTGLSEEDKEAIGDWVAENKWYTTNPKLRKEAINTELDIRKDPDFEYATMKEILAEVKTRVESKYSKSSGGSDLTETGGTGFRSNGIGKVKFSPVEMEIAKGFGIAPESVAKQKQLIQAENAKLKGRR